MESSTSNSGASGETRRKSRGFLSKFAMMTTQESQLRRQKALEEGKVSKLVASEDWLTGPRQANMQSNQMAYTIPYKADYEVVTNSSTSSVIEENCNDEDDRETHDVSCAASTYSGFDTVPSLPSIRGRRGRFRGGPAASDRSSSIDFERTSTVLPPSECEDFTSGLDVSELRRDFFSDYRTNSELPIYNYRSNVINSINSYSVVIIEGATGCGKTTQVPAYILEDVILEKKSPRAPVIYVTQPRRIAAKSIAQRVCDEHGWELGDLVGYQVSLEKKAGPRTILIFCTAGVLLQKLIQDKSLKSYTHIIIDEAHERDADTDLLLMMIRTLMRKENSFFRLIVMSATMNMQKFKEYFTFKTNYGHRAITTPSVCKIGQDTKPTNIQIIYFDVLKSNLQVEEPMPAFDIGVPELHEDCLKAARKIILDVIPHLDTYSEATKSTLVFLPGLAEIYKLHRMLGSREEDHIDIIPLHSCLPAQDQQRVFMPSKPGFRKVILATNIAESSITVKDAGFIIDFCLTRSLRKDEVTRFPTLKLQWATADKCIQRAGRTGRCCPGKVFRLVSTNFFKSFDEFAQPELLTAPLELSVLRVKNFQMGEVKALFAVVLDPPPINEIRTAVLELKQIGALSSTYEGKLSDIDGDLTELGRVISALPIDVHLSKLIVLASILDVLEDAIIVAACLSTNRTVVKQLYGNELQSYVSKLNWSHGSESDLIVCLDVYKEFIQYKDEQNKDQRWLEQYCAKNNLDDRKLHDVSALVEEIKLRLESLNIKVYPQPNRERDQFEDELMLKIAFCASFYPNYFLTQEMDTQDIRKALCGLDPTKTVIVHNIPINQAPLHRTTILEQMTRVLNYDINKIDYIADVTRAYLVINDDKYMRKDENMVRALKNAIGDQTPNISLTVYKALKSAECGRIHVREFREEAAADRMAYYKDQRHKLEEQAPGKLIPSMMKVVTRDPDNSRLLEYVGDQYQEFTSRNFYLEVQFNQHQDRKDLASLYHLENEELDRQKSNLKQENQISHSIFKDYKTLTGPTSPIQITFRSVLEKSKGYNVNLDKHSVNSIILNPDFEVQRRQLLVAAAVRQSKTSRILATDTTLMPNIRGLPTVMALLFAQYYRVIFNEQLNCLSGAIFGLGWDEDDKPLSREHQVELGFDVQITRTDIELINAARSHISELVKFVDQIQNPGAPRAELQERLREIILAIILRKRYPMNEILLSNINYQEGEFTLDKHNVPESHIKKIEPGQTRVFLPIMEATKDYSDWDMFIAIRRNLDFMDLIEAQQAKPPVGGLRCLLCGGGVDYLFLMRHEVVNHIFSESHLDRVIEFEQFEESARPSVSSE